MIAHTVKKIKKNSTGKIYNVLKRWTFVLCKIDIYAPKALANRKQSVYRKCYNEWCGSSGTSTPTKIKGYADENSLSLVGEDIILPQKKNANRT